MKITYLGTGAAEGVPAVFCNCATCKKAREAGGKEIRSRTQVLIDGELSIDFPPDAYYHSLRFGADLSAVKNLLVTHSHMDHFYAHDFILRGYKYASEIASPRLHIYGNQEVAAVFAECTRRELREDVKENISVEVITPFTEYAVDDYTVTVFPAVHSEREQALLYLVEKGDKSYLHLFDTGMPPSELFVWLKEKGKKVDLVSLDCTFVDKPCSSQRHMGLKQNAEVISRLKSDGVADGNTKFVVTHFSHNSEPFFDRLKSFEPTYGVIAAYDGLTIEF